MSRFATFLLFIVCLPSGSSTGEQSHNFETVTTTEDHDGDHNHEQATITTTLQNGPIGHYTEEAEGHDDHEDHESHEGHEDHEGHEGHDGDTSHEGHEDHEDHDGEHNHEQATVATTLQNGSIGHYAEDAKGHDDHEGHESHEGHEDHEGHDDDTSPEGHEDHEDHEDHEHPWEWAGIFQLVEGRYSWNVARKEGSYAAPSMKVLLLSGDNSSDARRLESSSHTAEFEAWELHASRAWPMLKFTDRLPGQELIPGNAYNLKFDQHSWISIFAIDVTKAGSLAFFVEHSPQEFGDGVHFLKSEAGADLEAVIISPGQSMSLSGSAQQSENKDDWGLVILGSFITCTPPLLGVFFAFFAFDHRMRGLLKAISPVIDSFASGVLSSAAVFLLLPEALHLAGSGHNEAIGAATWGTSILLGWLTCILIHQLSSMLPAKVEEADVKGEADPESMEAGAEKPISSKSLAKPNWMAIAGPVIFGDFFHNLTDGFVIAAAFTHCSSSFAWELIGITVIHELAQEIADLFLLVNDAGIKWYWATLANFLASLSTVLGAVIGYGTEVGSNAQGYILAYGAGVYLFIGMTELGASVSHLPQPSLNEMAKRLAPFAVGCIVIGLVLLNHEHCDTAATFAGASAGAADPHAGHNH